MIVIFFFAIIKPERRHCSPQDVHRRGAFRCAPQEINDRGIQVAFCSQPFVQFFVFVSGGEFAIPEQVAGFFKSGVVGEFVNVDAAVGQDPQIAVYVANLGCGGDHALQPFGSVHCGHGHFSSLKLKNGWAARKAKARHVATNFYTLKSSKFPR